MNVYEMEGFLRGNGIPGDLKVNESNAQYLVRKFSELQSQNAELAVQLANAESKCRELAAENAGLKNPDNWLSQSDYGYEASEVATQNGATEDESLRAGMIAIINRIGTPATDAFLAEVRAQGVERMIEVKQQQLDGMHPDTFAIGAVRDSIRRDIYELKVFAEILRQEAAQ
ncbi:TPA: hypothetical protein QFT17_004795 [Citrobacter freundii]|nr:hypothetical protein [Citrobacter freundii]